MPVDCTTVDPLNPYQVAVTVGETVKAQLSVCADQSTARIFIFDEAHPEDEPIAEWRKKLNAPGVVTGAWKPTAAGRYQIVMEAE